MKTCEHCSNKVEYDFRFCPNCGKDSHEQPREKVKRNWSLPKFKPLTLDKRSLFWFRGFLLVAFIFSMVAIRNYNTDKPDKDAWVKYKLNNGDIWWVSNDRSSSFKARYPDANMIGFSSKRPEESDAAYLSSSSNSNASDSRELSNYQSGNSDDHNSQADEIIDRQVEKRIEELTEEARNEALKSIKDYKLEIPELKLKLKEPIKFKKLEPPLSLMHQLNNGDSPYDSFFGKGVYDYSFENYIEIQNSDEADAIVILRVFETDECVRNEYVQRGSTFKMTNIRNGNYYIQYYSGNGWDSDKSFNGNLMGGFLYHEGFSESSKSDRIRMKQNDDRYSTYQITLYEVHNGNLDTDEIESDEFFR
jgi:hypothetical protein